jgi:hypothetical protein
MKNLARLSVAMWSLALISCAPPESSTTARSEVVPLIDMAWGSVASPNDTSGFGMRVLLQPDGRLSCQYGFSGEDWGFTGTTISEGMLTAGSMRWLERTFAAPEFLALPDEMPSGTDNPVTGDYYLATTFGSVRKNVRLVPGAVTSEAENDRLMQSVDAIFHICPTRPRTSIQD